MTISGISSQAAWPIRSTTPMAPAAPAAPLSRPAPLAPAAGSPEPALWQVLSNEERAFFLDGLAQKGATYNAAGGAGSAVQAPLGQRIDFRA